MTKDIILNILENHKDSIMTSFNIGEKEICNIREIVDKNYRDLSDAMNSIFVSNLNDREKMIVYYLVGYVNGIITR